MIHAFRLLDYILRKFNRCIVLEVEELKNNEVGYKVVKKMFITKID